MDRKLIPGLNPLAYQGVNPLTPPDLMIVDRPPRGSDYKFMELGTIWLDSGTHNPPTAGDIYMLVDIKNGSAVWVKFVGGTGTMSSLTGNTGGAVSPDLAGNIDVVSGIAGLTVDGTPLTNTLTINSSGGGALFQTLTPDAGGAVSPDGTGTINVLGTAGEIVTTGNPGTHTVTLSAGSGIATQYDGNVGSATPALGVLKIVGGTDCATSAAGNTVTINVTGSSGAVTQFTGDSGTAAPVAGNINLLGASGHVVTSAAGSTVTFDTGSNIADQYTTDDTNTATPSLGNLNVFGTAGNIATTSAGSTITINTGTNVATTYVCDSGSANPLSAILNIVGGSNVSTSGSGDTVTINSAVTPSPIKTSYFLSSGTWTKSPSASTISVYGWCGGGGGGGGYGNTHAGVNSGGGGGSQGTVFFADHFPTAFFGASESIVIGAGGAGGAGGLGGAGSNGSQGGVTSVGALFVPPPQANGGTGGNVFGPGGPSMPIIFEGISTIMVQGGANGNPGVGDSSVSRTITALLNESLAATGGGGGGGSNDLGPGYAGGNSGSERLPSSTIIVSGAAGSTDVTMYASGAGQNGYDGYIYNGVMVGGTGGGGGAGKYGNVTMIRPNGGNGGFPSAGGGGGGCVKPNSSAPGGDGGSGGDGLVIIIEYP